MKSLCIGLALLAAQLVPPAAAPASQRHVLIAVGLGGEPHYAKLFDSWASRMAEIAERAAAIDPERITIVRATGGDTARKEDLVAALQNLASASAPGDLIVMLLIGHGTAREDKALFNVPGPDLSADELRELLDRFDGRTVAVINATSSSGPFIRALSGENRVVITATASGSENQFAYFGGHFIGAFVAEAADADKNGRISLLEAFNHARRAVARAYEEDDKVLTEHALLDDDGDGIGSRLTEALSRDGTLAAGLYLEPSAGELAGGSEHARTLLALDVAAGDIVSRIDRLKRRRAQLLEEEYYRELESLLVPLAYNRREFRNVQNRHATPRTP